MLKNQVFTTPVSKLSESTDALCMKILLFQNRVSVQFFSDGSYLNSGSALVPKELAAFRLDAPITMSIEDKLIYVLDRFHDDIKIIVQIQDLEYWGTWSKEEKVQGTYYLRPNDRGVSLDVRFEDDNLHQYHLLGSKLIFSLHDMQLTRFQCSLPECLKEKKRASFWTFSEFNELNLCFFSDKDSQDLLINAVQITKPKWTAKINESQEDPNVYVIDLDSGQSNGTPYPRVLIELLQGLKVLFHPIKHEKRYLLMQRGLFMLMNAKTKEERDDVLNLAINETVFSSNILKQTAKRYLLHAFDEINRESFGLLQIGPDGFYVLSDPKHILSKALSIPYLLFDCTVNENLKKNRCIVPKNLLVKNLPTLHRLYETMGVDCVLEGKKVETVTLNISVKDMGRERTEWFDMHPTIATTESGDVIDFESVLTNPIIKIGKTVQVASEQSLATLDVLKTWFLHYEERQNRTYNNGLLQSSRLRVLDLIYLKNQGINLFLNPSDQALLDHLTGVKNQEEFKVAPRFKGDLWSFQKKGFDWLCNMYQFGFGACLADDMGLGKTVQAISFIVAVQDELIKHPTADAALPILLVVPPSLILNWAEELERFAPSIEVHIYAGQDRVADFRPFQVIVTSYDIVRRDIETFESTKFSVLVCDEAQVIKNMLAQRTQAMRRLSRHFTLMLSGTPIENHAKELFSILDMAVPGILGDYSQFNAIIKQTQDQFLSSRIRPFILRRKKEAVLKSLPPKVESDIYLELNEKQKSMYKLIISQVRKDVKTMINNQEKQGVGMIALTAILRLRQLCVSPQLLDSDYDELSPKVDCLMGRLETLKLESHSAIVFSQFTETLDICEKECKKRQIDVLRMDGKTPTVKRQKIVNEFQASLTPKVLIMSLKVGGVGLNLTQASYVFHMDPWWNPAVENQATDRVHRIGQKQKVLVTRLLMKHSIEEKMMLLKEKKLALYQRVLEKPDFQTSSGLQWEDFEQLLDLDMV